MLGAGPGQPFLQADHHDTVLDAWVAVTFPPSLKVNVDNQAVLGAWAGPTKKADATLQQNTIPAAIAAW